MEIIFGYRELDSHQNFCSTYLVGVVPYHKESRDFVQQQRNEQYLDAKHATKALRKGVEETRYLIPVLPITKLISLQYSELFLQRKYLHGMQLVLLKLLCLYSVHNSSTYLEETIT